MWDPLPNVIVLKNEKGETLELMVGYEWIPVSCKKCGVFGHSESRCMNVCPFIMVRLL